MFQPIGHTYQKECGGIGKNTANTNGGKVKNGFGNFSLKTSVCYSGVYQR